MTFPSCQRRGAHESGRGGGSLRRRGAHESGRGGGSLPADHPVAFGATPPSEGGEESGARVAGGVVREAEHPHGGARHLGETR
jgi:hypothetical protein